MGTLVEYNSCRELEESMVTWLVLQARGVRIVLMNGGMAWAASVQ